MHILTHHVMDFNIYNMICLNTKKEKKKSPYLTKFKVQGSLCFWKLLFRYSEKSKAINPTGNMQEGENHLHTVKVLLMDALFKATAVDAAPWFSFQSSIYYRETTMTFIWYWTNVTLHFSNVFVKISLASLLNV